MKKIVFIGGGHITQALIQGLVHSEVSPSEIIVSNPTLAKMRNFLIKTKVNSTTDNKFAVKNSSIIFICVRPAVVKRVVQEIRSSILTDAVIISVAACINFDLLYRYFGRKKVKLVRIMPNIPVKENKGVIGFIAGTSVSLKEKTAITGMLKKLGFVFECTNEKLLDKLSLISGCGPGIVSYFINTLKNESQHLGFSADQSETIALKTYEGTIAHLIQQQISPQTLVKEVATPGGVTESIIMTLSTKYPLLLRKSLKSGYDRITNIARELEEKA